MKAKDDEIVKQELKDATVFLPKVFVATCIFGLIGFGVGKVLNFEPVFSVIMGILAIPVLYSNHYFKKTSNKEPFIVISLIYLLSLIYIPTGILIIMILAFIFFYLIFLAWIAFRDRSKDVIVENKPLLKTNITGKIDEIEENNEEKFYCERCFKEITEEEYLENDGMCEDCFSDVTLNEDGSYNEKYWEDDRK